MDDGYTPTRDLPSEYREMLFIFHYSSVVCSQIFNKQTFELAGSTAQQNCIGWYATPTNSGAFYMRYTNSKFSLYDFYYQGASHHDATCDVYYR